MKTGIVLAIFLIILLLVMCFCILRKKCKLIREIEKITERDLWHKLAITDDLTGAYNRLAYSEYISKIEKDSESGKYAIILFDVDNFKRINDTEGYLVGDDALRCVSKTLCDVFPSPRYKVFRLNGDKFAVISKGASDDRITSALLKFGKVLKKESDLKVSNGYAIIKDSVKEAFDEAERMLYADKGAKKVR